MSPYLTGAGKWLFATGAIFTTFGALAREPLVVLFGQIPWWVLLGAMMLILTQSRALQRRQVVIAVALLQGPLRMRYGQGQTLKLSISNAAPVRLGRLAFEPVVSGGVEVMASPMIPGLKSGCQVGFEARVQAKHVGRASLQGFEVVLSGRWGLVKTRDYLPCVQVIEIYPEQAPDVRRRVARAPGSAAQPQRSVGRPASAGTDLRELRDYQPGDPLRAIAWKATLRQRRLISRDYDDERGRRHVLALDISTSMRSGTPPGLKLDFAIHQLCAQARALLAEGDEVAVYSFDHAIFGAIKPGVGLGHFQRVLHHVVGLRTIVDPARTAWDEDAVERYIADYLLVQERLDFRCQQGLDAPVDQRLLRRWLRAQLSWELARWKSEAEAHGVLEPHVSDARRFARLRGLELPPPPEMRAGTKINGLQALFEAVLGLGKGPVQLTIYSDLCGLNEVDVLERYVRLARRRGVRAGVVAPFTPEFGREELPADEHQARVRELFAIAEAGERASAASRMEALGVPVEFVGPRRGA
ncbi:DUF58 domain-containing protein [Lujinxingia litoralis]|nr:DUF58 domain-containing protein [Lujinxingia litoralis]